MSSTATDRSGTTTWTVDPAHSQVEFGVRHMMISEVGGYSPSVSGKIRLDEEDFTNSAVEVEIEASSIETGHPDRDAHLRSPDFFHVEEHPELRFESRAVEGSKDAFRIAGDLTMKGTTREVVLEGETLGDGTDPWGQQRLAFRAETEVNRKDFGLTWNQVLEAGGVLVGDDVRIRLEIQAVEERESGDGEEEAEAS